METLVLLVPAGRGARMGQDRPTAFLDLAGEALVLRAARVFEAAPSVSRIVAVVPEDEIAAARALLAPVRKLQAVVPGGERRQDSVREGLQQVPAGFDGGVLVHDAAPSRDGLTVTDEAMAVERHGAPVRAVPGSARNRKITTREDLAWAEGVLAGLVRA